MTYVYNSIVTWQMTMIVAMSNTEAKYQPCTCYYMLTCLLYVQTILIELKIGYQSPLVLWTIINKSKHQWYNSTM